MQLAQSTRDRAVILNEILNLVRQCRVQPRDMRGIGISGDQQLPPRMSLCHNVIACPYRRLRTLALLEQSEKPCVFLMLDTVSSETLTVLQLISVGNSILKVLLCCSF